VTHKRVVAVVILMWVFGAFISSIELLATARKHRFAVFAAKEMLCLISTAVLYSKIYFAVRHQANHIHALQVQQEAQNGEMANAERLRKPAVSIFYVYLVFFYLLFTNELYLFYHFYHWI